MNAPVEALEFVQRKVQQAVKATQRAVRETVIAHGQEWEVEFDYEPAERGSRECGIQMEPDYPESWMVTAIYLPGSDVNLSDYLTQKTADEIESVLVEQMKASRDEARWEDSL